MVFSIFLNINQKGNAKSHWLHFIISEPEKGTNNRLIYFPFSGDLILSHWIASHVRSRLAVAFSSRIEKIFAVNSVLDTPRHCFASLRRTGLLFSMYFPPVTTEKNLLNISISKISLETCSLAPLTVR